MKGKEDSGVDYMKIFQAIGDELSYQDLKDQMYKMNKAIQNK